MIAALLLLAQPERLEPPVVKDDWIVPAQGRAAEPVWGVKGGIAVGLWPTGGPRGLLRIYAPHVGLSRLRMINYIAVEPLAGGSRGLSELERSDLDAAEGKAMWTGNERETDPKPRKAWEPVSGKASGKELSFFVFVEAFKNGARPAVQVVLRKDRPFEVRLRVFASKGSAPMKACILSATMGNYAILRKLWLKDEVAEAARIWPDFKPDGWGFAPHRQWGIEKMRVSDGEATVYSTPGDGAPAYAKDVPSWWRYEGRPATQYWRAKASDKLVVRVNGRKTYWGTQAGIPGGVSFENFELEAPFEEGQEFVFGVSSEPPRK